MHLFSYSFDTLPNGMGLAFYTTYHDCDLYVQRDLITFRMQTIHKTRSKYCNVVECHI